MIHAIINKLRHSPMLCLKGRSDSRNLDVAQEIFQLSWEEIKEASDN